MMHVECVEWGRKHPGRALAALLMGGAGAILILVGIHQWHRYIAAIQPSPPIIDEVVVSPRDAYGAVKIQIKFLTSPTKHCVRLGSHMILPFPMDIEDPEFDLLAGSLAGDGYPTRTVGRFTATFHFPSTVEPGTYEYSYRRFLRCDPWKLIPFQDEVTARIVIPE